MTVQALVENLEKLPADSQILIPTWCNDEMVNRCKDVYAPASILIVDSGRVIIATTKGVVVTGPDMVYLR